MAYHIRIVALFFLLLVLSQSVDMRLQVRKTWEKYNTAPLRAKPMTLLDVKAQGNPGFDL